MLPYSDQCRSTKLNKVNKAPRKDRVVELASSTHLVAKETETQQGEGDNESDKASIQDS